MDLIVPIIGFLLLIYSIILHEIAHGYVAEKLGDPTARVKGRLTLNPIPHIDPLMTILFPLILFISHSPVIFGAAKPIPVDPFNFRQPRKDMGIVGLAGPATNFLLGAIAAIIFSYFHSSLPLFVLHILSNFVYLNFVLAAFNLIPIPPLDGSRILAGILPEEYASVLDKLEPYGLFILFFLLMFPIGNFSLGTIVSSLVSSWLHFFGL